MSIINKNVGFIGLGAMGRGMATQCIKKGFKLIVNDILPEPVNHLISLGAKKANSIKDLAKQCSTIITVLPTGTEVMDVLCSKEGVFENALSDTLIIELSTIDPNITDLIHLEGKKHKHRVLDAPIGRLAWHAERGESLFMVGGEQSDFEKAEPLLKAMGSTIYYCGKAGSGIRTKLVNNYLAIILCQLNAEALSLSQTFELDLETTLKVIHDTTATNGQLKINWPNKVLSGDTTPGFTINLAHKDLSLILGAANSKFLPLPLAAATRESFSGACSQGYGDQDFSAIADVLCNYAKIPRPRLK